MEKFRDHLMNWNQPQLFSLIITILIILILSIATYVLIKIEDRPDKAPSSFLVIMEGYIEYVDNTYLDATENKIQNGKVYIFSLVTMLLVGNLIGLFGLEPIATSYSITLTLALISWLGIYVVGFMYQKFRFFMKYLKNPIEILGQFAPLISLSFRIYGNIIGGGTIVILLYLLAGYIWQKIPGQANAEYIYFFAPIVTPFLHIYFDIFGAFIQALVFASLTTIYWSSEATETVKKSKKQNIDTDIKVVNMQQNIY